MTHIAKFSVTISVNDAESTVEGVMRTEQSWQDLTEAQIKEKVGQAYRDALRSVLNARKAVTPS